MQFVFFRGCIHPRAQTMDARADGDGGDGARRRRAPSRRAHPPRPSWFHPIKARRHIDGDDDADDCRDGAHGDARRQRVAHHCGATACGTEHFDGRRKVKSNHCTRWVIARAPPAKTPSTPLFNVAAMRRPQRSFPRPILKRGGRGGAPSAHAVQGPTCATAWPELIRIATRC